MGITQTDATPLASVSISINSFKHERFSNDYRSTSYSRKVNGSTDYAATLEYDPLQRLRKFCWTGNQCHQFYYVGNSNWLSWVEDGGNITREIYLYANGRPLRVGLRYINQFPPWYQRYNGRGDAAGFVEANGSGGAGWKSFGAWGDVNYASDYKGYYNWNGAWGYSYMSFPPSFNFNLNDGLDTGLYYAHGRWYNQDTGLWLSPNEKGDYLYGGDGQDPVNVAWNRNVSKSCTDIAQTEITKCEEFVDEVRRFINLARQAGASDDVIVMLLAEYYSGIPATYQFETHQPRVLGPSVIPDVSVPPIQVTVSSLPGLTFIPGLTPAPVGFPGE